MNDHPQAMAALENAAKAIARWIDYPEHGIGADPGLF